jgi:hypothetical protein
MLLAARGAPHVVRFCRPPQKLLEFRSTIVASVFEDRHASRVTQRQPPLAPAQSPHRSEAAIYSSKLGSHSASTAHLLSALGTEGDGGGRRGDGGDGELWNRRAYCRTAAFGGSGSAKDAPSDPAAHSIKGRISLAPSAPARVRNTCLAGPARCSDHRSRRTFMLVNAVLSKKMCSYSPITRANLPNSVGKPGPVADFSLGSISLRPPSVPRLILRIGKCYHRLPQRNPPIVRRHQSMRQNSKSIPRQ